MSTREEQIREILKEVWSSFHPAILWWANEKAATDPANIRVVYRELLSGPSGAMIYAQKLWPYLASEK